MAKETIEAFSELSTKKSELLKTNFSKYFRSTDKLVKDKSINLQSD